MESEIPKSLKDHAKFRILNEMMEEIRKNSETPEAYFTMVVDDYSVKVISSVCKPYDLINFRIAGLERLALKRKKFPSSEGIYFVEPCADSIDQIAKDFESTPTQYKYLHLCFLSRLDDMLFKNLSTNRNLVPRIKTLREVNVNFLLYEPNIFHLGSSHSLNIFSDDDPYSSLLDMSVKLLSVCATLYEFPHIQYYGKSKLAKELANLLQAKLTQFEATSHFHVHTPKATFIILDRTHDMFSPLLHDFNYESLVFDLLDVSGKTLKIKKGTEEKKIMLNEDDSLWERMRYRHIAEVLTTVSQEFQDFAAENKHDHVRTQGIQDLEEMGDLIKKMPTYQEMLAKYTNHMLIASEAMKAFNLKDLKGLAKLEQSIITGVDDQYKEVQNKAVIAAITKLTKEYLGIGDDEVVRILILYLCAFDIPVHDREIVLSYIKNPDKREILSKLVWLGYGASDPRIKKVKRREPKMSKEDFKIFTARNASSSIEVLRFIPKIAKVGIDCFNNDLGLDEFPFISGEIPESYLTKKKEKSAAISIKKPKLNSNWAEESKEQGSKARIIIFVIGGLSHQEISTIYNLQLHKFINTSVMLGSTSILTPTEFLKAIQKIGIHDDVSDPDSIQVAFQ